jgi:hypothetical protein
MMYKIQMDIPMPPRGSAQRLMKYPFAEMLVGESFLVPKAESKGDLKKLMSRVGAAAAGAKKALGFKFAVRKMPDGVRIWRVQ